MIEKEVVRDNFSRAADSYDQYAVVQRYMAKKLDNYLQDIDEVDKVLEIGGGTGLFTELLINRFLGSNYLIVDISPKMIAKCRDKFRDYQQVKYLLADGERLKLEEKFDLIISNATFQWFENLKLALINLKEQLNEDGEIYFSIFGDKTFQELRNCFQEVKGEDSYSQKFFSKFELEGILAEEFRAVEIREEEYIERFTNVRDFLRATKKIGANSAKKDKPPLTPGSLKKIERKYMEKYREDNQIIVTHHLLFVRLQK
jgi:malonyl-CoA O-methyltransferase